MIAVIFDFALVGESTGHDNYKMGRRMKKKFRNLTVGFVSTALAGIAGVATAGPVESVVGLDVHNPGAFLGAVRNYYSSDESHGNVTIWAVEFGGDTEISHLAIGDFEGYADYEKVTSDRRAGTAWVAFAAPLTNIIDVESRLMAIERFREGTGWRNHGAMAAFVMTVTDPAEYVAAFSELVESSDNPGSVRLMEMRFGGQGATHAALISAASITELNEYLDELLTSNAYRKFADDVSDIRTIHNVQMMRRVVSYGD